LFYVIQIIKVDHTHRARLLLDLVGNPQFREEMLMAQKEMLQRRDQKRLAKATRARAKDKGPVLIKV
jgi:hypothetical protein